ncbi:hypothetical protein [Blautia sp.]|uniref:hypothetical protein n=1 Tax=Blautia sp. TaxID=1955243 RepID=UPI0026260351|nr:hypothetical protein [Blautia sp.]
MLKGKKNPIVLVLLVLMIFETSCSKDKKQEVNSAIEFTHFTNKENDIETAISPSKNNLLYVETKSAQIKNKQNDIEYTSNLVSFDHGTATYFIEADLSSVDEGDLEITYPVFYIEEQLDKKQLLYPPTNGSETFVEISDSSIEYPDAGRGVLIKVVSSDLERLPYQIVLNSGGKTYDGAISYYFDTISGNFKEGYYIMLGVTMEELEENVTVEASSILRQYIATEFDIVQE